MSRNGCTWSPNSRSNLTDASACGRSQRRSQPFQSALFHSVGLTEDQLRQLLTESAAACSVLMITPRWIYSLEP